MKNFARRAIVGLMSIGLVTAFAGTISGSIAWYAYSTRASVTYSGTSVSESIQLQIGLVSDQDFTVDGEGHDRGLNLIPESVPGESYSYYWAKSGSGFDANAIKAYLETEGTYSVNKLTPVTTREYDGSSFALYRAPLRNVPVMNQAAPTKHYSHIPFVFRIIDANGNYVHNADIWLTDATVAASGENEAIREAIRLYFSEGSNDFVLNPSSTEESVGYTKVGGLLDLVPNGVYDNDGTREILYGDWNTTPTVTGTATADNHLMDPSVFDDVNLTRQTAKSTFVAEHLKGIEYYDRYALVDTSQPFMAVATFSGTGITGATVNPTAFNFFNLNRLGSFLFEYDGTRWKLGESTVSLVEYGITVVGTPANGDQVLVETDGVSLAKTAKYETLATIRPNDDGGGYLSGGTPLTRTDSVDGLARLDVTIYLEGWDHSVIDKEIGHSFNLGLRFQINRV